MTIYQDELELDHKEMSGQVPPKDVAAHFAWLMDSTVGQEGHDELGAMGPSLFKLRDHTKYVPFWLFNVLSMRLQGLGVCGAATEHGERCKGRGGRGRLERLVSRSAAGT
jgi:hypothetical protein